MTRPFKGKGKEKKVKSKISRHYSIISVFFIIIIVFIYPLGKIRKKKEKNTDVKIPPRSS